MQQNLGLELPIFIDETQSSTGFERIANQQIIEFKTTETDETNLVGVKIDDVYKGEIVWVRLKWKKNKKIKKNDKKKNWLQV